MASATHDLLIIGGGINGLGVAAEAAARGLSVVLAERGDFGGGTTAASSRLIHGGLRYLQYGELSLVRESLRERGLLARQRPHLVRPIQLLIPCLRGMKPPAWQVGVGLRLYDVLARDPLFPSPRGRSLAETLECEPGIRREGLCGSFSYPDAQAEFPERLCVDLALEARAAGAEVLNHTRAVSLLSARGRVVGAELVDALTGRGREVRARLTLNAAGPWVDAVNRLLPEPPPALLGGTWGTHLVLPTRPDGPRGPIYTAARRDGRPIFLLPWDGRLLVGTTDVPFQDDPDRLVMADWEPGYLLEEANALFPGCRYSPEEVQYTTVGIRPLPRSDRTAGAITRRHFLVDHQRRHGIAGLASLVGGKLTTYRSLGEEVVAWVARRGELPVREPHSPTRRRAGGLGPETLRAEAAAALRGHGWSDQPAARLVRLYGPRYEDVLRTMEESGAGESLLVDGCSALAAEVLHAVQREQARTPEDVLLRRLMLLPPPEGAEAAVRRLCGQAGLVLAGTGPPTGDGP